jgi:hypothetical protein
MQNLKIPKKKHGKQKNRVIKIGHKESNPVKILVTAQVLEQRFAKLESEFIKKAEKIYPSEGLSEFSKTNNLEPYSGKKFLYLSNLKYGIINAIVETYKEHHSDWQTHAKKLQARATEWGKKIFYKKNAQFRVLEDQKNKCAIL